MREAAAAFGELMDLARREKQWLLQRVCPWRRPPRRWQHQCMRGRALAEGSRAGMVYWTPWCMFAGSASCTSRRS